MAQNYKISEKGPREVIAFPRTSDKGGEEDNEGTDYETQKHLIVPDEKGRLERAPYLKTRENFQAKYRGKCFCETVRFELAEEPLGSCVKYLKAISSPMFDES